MPVLYPPPTGLGESFAYGRSYIYGFATNWPPGSINSFAGGVWKITLTPPYGVHFKLMEFTADFLAWNSSRWHFSQLWQNFYVQAPPAPPVAPEGFNIHMRIKPTTTRQYIALEVGFWTDWYYIDLPSAPPGYWVAPQL